MKNATARWWPVEFGAFTIGGVFKALPIACGLQILMDFEDLARAGAEKQYSRRSRGRGFRERSGSAKRRRMRISFR
jgi:hypothetical protein